MADPFWFKAGGNIASSIGNTLAADLDLVLLPAGHTPGLYLCSTFVLTRQVALTGTLTKTLMCNGPGGVAGNALTSTSGPQPTTLGWSAATGSQWYAPQAVISDGSTAIIARYARVGVTGSPIIDFYGLATMLSLF